MDKRLVYVGAAHKVFTNWLQEKKHILSIVSVLFFGIRLRHHW